jgi:hypothetical protein
MLRHPGDQDTKLHVRGERRRRRGPDRIGRSGAHEPVSCHRHRHAQVARCRAASVTSLSLLKEQWSAAQGELAYLQTLADTNGLIAVGASDAQDWLPNFASPTNGEVAATNKLYY